jgi:hypothetical protein
MSVSLIQSVVSLPQSPFPPLAVGFMGLGTGYLIYGPQELLGYPARNDSVDFATGMWGIWMPGFMQFITGIIVFFKVGDAPVGGLFIGLACVYAVDFLASLKPDLPKLGGWDERALGFFHLGTGLWLMYLVFAVALNFILNYALPL